MLLNALREGAKSGIVKFFLMGLMVMAVAGLVLMDIGGFFRGGVQPNTVAKIGGEQLSAATFDTMVRRILSRQGLDTATAWQLGFIQQILNSEINNNLLYRAAQDVGIRVSDDVIAEQVNAIITPLVTSDLTRKQALERILLNQGMSEAQFAQALRNEIANTMLRNAVQLSGAYMSETEARLLYQHQNEKRVVEGIVLPHDSIKDYQEPTDEVLRPFYQAGQERYAIPETRKITLAVLTPDSLKETLDISEEELKQIYEDEIESYRIPERRRMAQAVLNGQAEALSVVEKIGDGKISLENAVKAVTGKMESYLGEETFEQGGLVEAIGTAAFSAGKGEVVGPVETPLGWHVLVVKEILPPATKTFEEVKDQLRTDILQNRASEQMYAAAGSIDDQLAGGANLEEVAENMGMSIRQHGPFRADGSTPDNKEGIDNFEDDRADILETSFELMEGESSPVMELADGSLGVVRVDEIAEKSYTPFEDIKDDLREIWIADQQQVLNKRRAQEALQAVAGGEKSLADIGAVETYTLTRGGDLPSPLTPAARGKFFVTGKDNYAMAETENGFIVGKVRDVTLPDADKIDAAALEEIRKGATRAVQEEFLTAYLQSLRAKYNVKINDRLLDTMYAPGGNERF